MARLPWARGNLLIAFTPNDIIKELGPCVSPLPVFLSISLSLRHTVVQEKIAKGIEQQRWRNETEREGTKE